MRSRCSCPPSAASQRGVRPSALAASGAAPARSSNFAADSCPSYAARMSAVNPLPSAASTSVPKQHATRHTHTQYARDVS
eukprot:8693883-Pyramimonas_sp.AAC.1